MNDKRLRLVDLLTEAAELEHALSCQYLFAAFTLKNRPEEGATWPQLESIRRWKGEMLLIARQEMEHLGLVANLLTAIGEAPYFARPDFPTAKRTYPIDLACELEPFGERALERFARFEWPDDMPAHARVFAETIALDVERADPSSIARIYDEIRALFVELGARPDALFVGPPNAQASNATILPLPLRGIQLKPGTAFYNVLVQPVIDLPSALAAIDQIRIEGEGTPKDRAQSHFGRFVRMHGELRAARAADPSFEPARRVIANPRTAYEGEDPTPSTITRASTNDVAQLFDLGYATMLLMLVRFFAHSDETAAELGALQGTAFFPLMTNFLRPIGEILTQLDARDDAPGLRAGPPFRFPRRVAFLPHKRAAWRVIHEQLRLLEARADALRGGPYPPDTQARLALVHENVGRMRINFANAMGLPTSGGGDA